LRRPRRIAVVALCALGFLAVSFELARWLYTETDERNQVFALLKAQARGDEAAMLRELAPSCARTPACRELVAANARRLRRRGTVKILAYDSDTAYSLGSATGKTRVAWTVLERGLPVVQCVLVRRTGSALSGRSIQLLRLSAPIDSQGTC
jgi:hypothetical protein